ncbi:LPS export ABC transporter permease LptF [Cognatiyoonia sp.]|uniref:LPS export ABC transporter permease LptF n=1 Tax=Cognatiyoonia sp. TaxID=2211652 RepID=UPI003F69D349
MARFDGYMLSQLTMLFGFFSLILILVYWINRAVRLFDQLIADGQSAVVFLEFTALSLPGLVRLVLPLAAFAAAVYVTNRMSSESELVVVQSTGYSPWRLAWPVFLFGLLVAILMTLLMHVLVPLSTSRLNDRTAELAENATARLLTEGQFMEPADGITVYIAEITPAGELRNVFLSDLRDPNRQITYTASRAYLVRDATETQLVMIDGLAQTFVASSDQLFATSFEDFTYNIGALLTGTKSDRRQYRELLTTELLAATPDVVAETRQSRAQLIAEAHNRISQSLLGLIGALLGFSALLVGGYSRFGVWRQILFAIFLIVIIKGVETVGLSAARQSEAHWLAVYYANFVGLTIVVGLLWISARPDLLKKRRVAA